MKHKFQLDNITLSFTSSPNDAKFIMQILTELHSGICFSNSDFVDKFNAETIKYILDGTGTLTLSTAQASGENRALFAALKAVKDIHNAKMLIVEFATGQDITLKELSDAANFIKESSVCSGLFVWGHVINYKESCEVNIIADV